MAFTVLKDERCIGCYGAGKVFRGGKEDIAFVSETEGNGTIDLVNPETLEVTHASKGPGGGMNIIPIPKRDGEFLCIQKFYPVFKSEEAVVIWGWEDDGNYTHKEVLQLPFVHRIELLTVRDEDYLLCSSLCRTKKYIDDWRYPGSVYIGKIDYENRKICDFHMVWTGIIQNHGLTKIGETGVEGVLISGQNGVNRLIPPKEGIRAAEHMLEDEVCSGNKGGAADGWTVVNEIDEPTSDCAIADIDGDGEPEYGTITPFHGEHFHIYKRIAGKMQKIWTLPGTHAFGHAIWGGRLNGRNAFLVGYRSAGMELYLIEMKNGKITADMVDEHGGPANVTVVHSSHGDLICAANRQSDRYTVYQEN